MCSKQHKRHKLLLDEGLHLPQAYPNLNSRHDVLHVKETAYAGRTDEIIFRLAQEQDRMLVVFNRKDFRTLIRPDKPSIICLSTHLPDQQVDTKLCHLLRRMKPSEEKGRQILVSNEGIQFVTD